MVSSKEATTQEAGEGDKEAPLAATQAMSEVKEVDPNTTLGLRPDGSPRLVKQLTDKASNTT